MSRDLMAMAVEKMENNRKQYVVDRWGAEGTSPSLPPLQRIENNPESVLRRIIYDDDKQMHYMQVLLTFFSKDVIDKVKLDIDSKGGLIEWRKDFERNVGWCEDAPGPLSQGGGGTRRKSSHRRSSRRRSSKRKKSTRRKSIRRKSTRRKSTRRKFFKRTSKRLSRKRR